MKVAVIGSRGFCDYEMLSNELDAHEITQIVSGGAKGADSLAERYAKEKNIETVIFKADWKRFGRSAGVIRNKDIIENCDFVIAFWDGKSKGTLNSIKQSKKLGKEVILFEYC